MPVKVLVTRPDGQAASLMALLAEHGFTVRHEPALQIEPVPLVANAVASLDRAHAAFFVSANAARLALPLIADAIGDWPDAVHCLAVGEATAGVLRDAGLPVVVPAEGFNSEAVLALPCLARLDGKRVLVFRGDGGRELFAGALRDRGASVDYIQVYRRHCNTAFCYPPDTDVMLVTSVQSWHCMAGRISGSPVVVAGSERIADAIRADFGGRVVAAASPHDMDMLATLERL